MSNTSKHLFYFTNASAEVFQHELLKNRWDKGRNEDVYAGSIGHLVVCVEEDHFRDEDVGVLTSVHIPQLVCNELANAIGHDRKDEAQDAEGTIQVCSSIQEAMNGWHVEAYMA